MWTLHRQQQQRGAQLHARAGKAEHAPADAVEGREAQDHEHAAEDVAGELARPGESPASPIENREQDITPAAPDPRASWDEAVQPERRKHARGPEWDEQPLPEGK